jgi:hypothetical protein
MRIAMIAITTNSSMSVNAALARGPARAVGSRDGRMAPSCT